MLLLTLGVVLWSFTHFLPTRFIGLRSAIVSRVGVMPYKGLFSVSIVASIVMMVFGWKSAIPQPLYDLGEWGLRVGGLLILAGGIGIVFAPVLAANPWLFNVRPY